MGDRLYAGVVCGVSVLGRGELDTDPRPHHGHFCHQASHHHGLGLSIFWLWPFNTGVTVWRGHFIPHQQHRSVRLALVWALVFFDPAARLQSQVVDAALHANYCNWHCLHEPNLLFWIHTACLANYQRIGACVLAVDCAHPVVYAEHPRQSAYFQIRTFGIFGHLRRTLFASSADVCGPDQ